MIAKVSFFCLKFHCHILEKFQNLCTKTSFLCSFHLLSLVHFLYFVSIISICSVSIYFLFFCGIKLVFIEFIFSVYYSIICISFSFFFKTEAFQNLSFPPKLRLYF